MDQPKEYASISAMVDAAHREISIEQAAVAEHELCMEYARRLVVSERRNRALRYALLAATAYGAAMTWDWIVLVFGRM